MFYAVPKRIFVVYANIKNFKTYNGKTLILALSSYYVF